MRWHHGEIEFTLAVEAIGYKKMLAMRLEIQDTALMHAPDSVKHSVAATGVA